MAEVKWTKTALSDLDEIGEYISKDSIRYAELTVSKLFESPDILEKNPRAGNIVPELNNESIRQLIRGSYRIIYHMVDEATIEILTVHRSSRLIGNTYNFEDLVNE
ncbi:MAG: type II toxin-antitoxin system RelE/ParE family toxin [Bacteroidales bacterium]